MKTLAALLTIVISCTHPTQALQVTLGVYTASPEAVRNNINYINGVFLGTDTVSGDKDTSYTIDTPLQNQNNYCWGLQKDLGTHQYDRDKRRSIVTGLSLYYTPVYGTDPPSYQYDEPIAVALWDRPPRWRYHWWKVLERFGRLDEYYLNLGYCLGDPDLLLTFTPKHDMRDDKDFFNNFVVVPSDMNWLKDYRHFMFIGATQEDKRYKRWSKSVKRKLSGKNYNAWSPWYDQIQAELAMAFGDGNVEVL